MRRRMFLRSVGAAAAGIAVGLRAPRARASEVQLGRQFNEARRIGKPVLVAIAASEADRVTLQEAWRRIRNASDRELVLRSMLVEVSFADALDVRLLTEENVRVASPALVLLDGEPPQIAKEMTFDIGDVEASAEHFLREAVPLTAAWLAQRVALMSRHDAAAVRQLRRRLAAGEPARELAQYGPAIVIREAFRRKGAVRDKLIAELLAPPPSPGKKNYDEVVDQCGLGMKMLTPLGLRFVDAFTKPDGEP